MCIQACTALKSSSDLSILELLALVLYSLKLILAKSSKIDKSEERLRTVHASIHTFIIIMNCIYEF